DADPRARDLPGEPGGPRRSRAGAGGRDGAARVRHALDRRALHPAASPAYGDVIDLGLELPLARFSLRVDAQLRDGITAGMGRSGSGKASLLEAVAGLRSRTRGRIVVNGNTLLDTTSGVRLRPEHRRVGYVPQDAGLFPHLTALDNVRFGARGAAD